MFCNQSTIICLHPKSTRKYEDVSFQVIFTCHKPFTLSFLYFCKTLQRLYRIRYILTYELWPMNCMQMQCANNQANTRKLIVELSLIAKSYSRRQSILQLLSLKYHMHVILCLKYASSTLDHPSNLYWQVYIGLSKVSWYYRNTLLLQISKLTHDGNFNNDKMCINQLIIVGNLEFLPQFWFCTKETTPVTINNTSSRLFEHLCSKDCYN